MKKKTAKISTDYILTIEEIRIQYINSLPKNVISGINRLSLLLEIESLTLN